MLFFSCMCMYIDYYFHCTFVIHVNLLYVCAVYIVCPFISMYNLHVCRPNLYLEINLRSDLCENNIKPLLVSSRDPNTGRSVSPVFIIPVHQ